MNSATNEVSTVEPLSAELAEHAYQEVPMLVFRYLSFLGGIFSFDSNEEGQVLCFDKLSDALKAWDRTQ